MSPEHSLPSHAEQHRRELLNILRECQDYLTNYIQEIPMEIISAGSSINDKTAQESPGGSTTHKCQRNWLNGVVGRAGLIQAYFPQSSEIWQKAHAFEQAIIARSLTPIRQDPHLYIDQDGRPHRLTTQAEIALADAFLTYLTQQLQSFLAH